VLNNVKFIINLRFNQMLYALCLSNVLPLKHRSCSI